MDCNFDDEDDGDDDDDDAEEYMTNQDAKQFKQSYRYQHQHSSYTMASFSYYSVIFHN